MLSAPPTARNALTVVVVTYNSAPLLPDLIASFPDALAGVGPWQLVVADNASADDTLQTVAEHAPDATVVAVGRNAGYAAGINAALAAAAPAEAVLILNPDIRLAAGSVSRLLAVLDEPGVGIAVPRLTDEEGRLAYSLRREPTVLRALGEAFAGGRAGRHPRFGETVQNPDSYARPSTADWASGAAMVVSRRCLETVGAWDESFFLYSEETDFALRARDAGFALRYEPAATAVHIGGESHVSSHLWSILTVNRVRLFARRHGAVKTAAFWLAVAARECLRALAGRVTSRAALQALLFPSKRPEQISADRALATAVDVPLPARPQA